MKGAETSVDTGRTGSTGGGGGTSVPGVRWRGGRGGEGEAASLMREAPGRGGPGHMPLDVPVMHGPGSTCAPVHGRALPCAWGAPGRDLGG